jgi:hypothetical protein
MSILNLIDPRNIYGLYAPDEARDSFHRIFNADPRLDEDDRALLREYLEYRISNGDIVMRECNIPLL